MLASLSTEILLRHLRNQESVIRTSSDRLIRARSEVFAIDLRNELLSRGVSEEQVYPNGEYIG
jgi:hypothetical protein